MNKRLFPRYNLANMSVPVDVIDSYNEPTLGKLRDISKVGISFYTNEKTLIKKYDNIVDVILFSGTQCIAIEVEILREVRLENGCTIHAGRFVGMPSLVYSSFPDELVRSAERELILL